MYSSLGKGSLNNINVLLIKVIFYITLKGCSNPDCDLDAEVSLELIPHLIYKQSAKKTKNKIRKTKTTQTQTTNI